MRKRPTFDDNHRMVTATEPESVEDVLELGVDFADGNDVTLSMALMVDVCRRIKALEDR